MLLVLDESGRGLGGVPVFNMELAKGLAQSHDVTVLTVNARDNYNHAEAQQQHGTDDIVNIRPEPGQENMEGRDRLTELAAQPTPPPGIGSQYDMIVGHSRFSGPAAEQMRNNWFPDAKLVHFLHTSPVRLDVAKLAGPKATDAQLDQGRGKGGKKATQERQVMPKADLVVGVGDLLASEAERLSQQIFNVPAVHTMIPGTEVGPLRDSKVYGPDTPITLLLSGRATDPIKNVEGAVRAIGQLQQQGVPVKLIIRGGPDSGNPQALAEWQSLIDQHGGGAVEMRPFTSDANVLAQERNEVDAFLMSSLHEGFGLVATEGAGTGTPVLVNEESGGAGFFQSLGHGHNVVGNTSDPQASVTAWADAIKDLHANMNERVQQARELRDQLGDYSWANAAQAMVDAAMSTPPPNAKPLSDRYDGRYHGAVTRQGPAGTNEVRGQRGDWQPGNYWSGRAPLPATSTTSPGATRADLQATVAQLPPPRSNDPAPAVTTIRDSARSFYPGGIRGTVGPGSIVRSATDPGGQASHLTTSGDGQRNPFSSVPDRSWQKGSSWSSIRNQLVQGGPGTTAFVLPSGPGAHTVTGRMTSDGNVQFVDHAPDGSNRIVTDPRRLPAPVGSRSLIVGPNGQVTPGPQQPQSKSAPETVTDARWGSDTTPTQQRSDGPAPAPTRFPGGMQLIAATDSTNLQSAQNFGGIPGQYTVMAHGSADNLLVGGQKVTPAELADMIRNDPAWNNQPITLISCDTGSTTTGFAAELARLLPGTPVTAPNNKVWTTNDGHAYVAGSQVHADGTMRPTTPTPADQFQQFIADPTVDGAPTVEVKPAGNRLSNTTPPNPVATDPSTDRPANPWKLSDAENQRIYREIVLPRALQGVQKPAVPKIVFIGGQAASSKTTGQQAALKQLGQDGGIVADFDALLSDHPGYEEMKAQDDTTAAQLAGDDAIVWMRQLVEHARTEKLNLIREGHMGGGSTEKEAVKFKASGFRTEADVMAVPAAISRLANLHRYQTGREQSGVGRIVATPIHDNAYTGIPKTLDGADNRKFLDEIRLHKWGGGLVYQNSVNADGKWSHPGSAAEALESQRSAPLAPEQAKWLQERFAHLDRNLPSDIRAQLPDIANLAHDLGVTLTPTPDTMWAPAITVTDTDGQTTDVPLPPAADTVRESLPPYLRDNQGMGVASQRAATVGVDLAAAVKQLAPGISDADAELIQRTAEHSAGSYLGKGHSYQVTVNGKPAELTVQSAFDWSGLDVTGAPKDPASGKADLTGKIDNPASSNRGHGLRRQRGLHRDAAVDDRRRHPDPDRPEHRPH